MRPGTARILISGLTALTLIATVLIAPKVSAESPSPWDVSWIPSDAARRSKIKAAIDAIVIDPQMGSIGGSASGLKGKGAVILQYSLESIDGNPAGVNPAFALAMFREEANFAAPIVDKKPTIAYTQNNPGNMRCAGVYGDTDCKNSRAVFPRMDDGIKAYFWLLTREYKPGGKYKNNRNCTTIACIAQAFCPPSDCDTNEYISRVTKWTNTFQSTLSDASRLDYDARTDNSLIPVFLLPTANTTVQIKFTNTGSKPWLRSEVDMVNTNGQPLGANPRHALPADTVPGGVASFDLQVNAPGQAGVFLGEWQLERVGQRFGPKVTITLTVAPKEAEAWWDQFVAWVQDTATQLVRAIAEALRKVLEQGL